MNLTVIDLREGNQAPPPRSLAIEADVVATVREVIDGVRRGGDRALVELTRRFDHADVSPGRLIVAQEEFDRAREAVPPDIRSAIDGMVDRLRDLHARQLPREWWEERDGVRFGEVVRPVARAGCYVPGGRAAYPSTVAMTAVPAAVAGVEQIVVATPPRPDGSLPPQVLYAAERAGVHLVAKVGGAQAIGAMAYGTESIPAVDTIVGPGNVYVTAAKREVAGEVGIDGLAGPTELAVVAGESADPDLVAVDLVAQAEHDPLATATVITTEDALVPAVEGALEREAEAAARREIVEAALAQARVLLVADLEQAAGVVDDLAPEHLEVLLPQAREFLSRVRNAGAAFLGPWSAVPFGDYGVGSNHVLPTLATARFASGLRAAHFVTVSAVVELRPDAAARLAPEVAALARAEGLDAHGRAVELRAAAAGGGGR